MRYVCLIPSTPLTGALRKPLNLNVCWEFPVRPRTIKLRLNRGVSGQEFGRKTNNDRQKSKYNFPKCLVNYVMYYKPCTEAKT